MGSAVNLLRKKWPRIAGFALVLREEFTRSSCGRDLGALPRSRKGCMNSVRPRGALSGSCSGEAGDHAPY